MKEKGLNYYFYEVVNEKGILKFLQPITIKNLHHFDKIKPFGKTFANINQLELDFSEVKSFDSSVVLLVNDLRFWAKSARIELLMTGMTPQLSNFLQKFSELSIFERKETSEESHFISYFSSIGDRIVRFFWDYVYFFDFFGEVLVKSLASIIGRRKIRWQDFPLLFLKNGVNALPIVSLILLLIGIISGYQGAIQLKQFGADIYIADLIGVSITRELGPLMTAIIVAGRSGSAFAAEIGTMKVSEEIDALRSMGFDPFTFLIIPRVLAVTFSIPLLTMFGNLAGILGGLISGLAMLDITTVGYFTQLQIAVDLGDVFSGVFKSIIFGFLIATLGCFRGMQVRGGAESVGTYTTISVVSGIFAIIVADTIFTFIFDAIGL